MVNCMTLVSMVMEATAMSPPCACSEVLKLMATRFSVSCMSAGEVPSRIHGPRSLALKRMLRARSFSLVFEEER